MDQLTVTVNHRSLSRKTSKDVKSDFSQAFPKHTFYSAMHTTRILGKNIRLEKIIRRLHEEDEEPLTVEHLGFRDGHISAADLLRLSESLSATTRNLRFLSLGYCGSGLAGLGSVFDALLKNETRCLGALEQLRFPEQDLKGLEAVHCIQQLLHFTPNLLELHLEGNDFSSDDISALSPCIGNLSQLQVLSLSFSRIDSSCVEFLCCALSRLLQLEQLDLNDCQIDDDVIIPVAEAVRHLPILSVLSLTENKIGDIGAKCICSAVGDGMPSLAVLALHGNDLTEQGVMKPHRLSVLATAPSFLWVQRIHFNGSSTAFQTLSNLLVSLCPQWFAPNDSDAGCRDLESM